MGDDELEVVGAKALEFLKKRERKIVILDDEGPAPTFDVSTAFKGLYQQFAEARPKKGESGYPWHTAVFPVRLDSLCLNLRKGNR